MKKKAEKRKITNYFLFKITTILSIILMILLYQSSYAIAQSKIQSGVSSEKAKNLERAQVLLSKGIELYKNSNFDSAIFELKEAATILNKEIDKLSQTGKLINAYLYLGLAYIGLNDNVRAKVQFSEIVRLDRDYKLSADKYSKKVILLFNESRAETFAKILKEEKEAKARVRFKEKEEKTKNYNETPQKKKWYKKWWVWGLAGVGVVALAASNGGNKGKDNTPPQITNIEVDPNSNDYSFVQILKLKCIADDSDGDVLTYKWTCDKGNYENGSNNYSSSTNNSVRWSFTQYNPSSKLHQGIRNSNKLPVKITFSKHSLATKSPTIHFRSSIMKEKRHKSPIIRKTFNLIPLPWKRLMKNNIKATSTFSTLKTNEDVKITCKVEDTKGLQDVFSINVSIGYYIPVDKIGFSQGATGAARDVRLKDFLISLNGEEHFGPYQLEDVGTDSTEKTISFPSGKWRSSFTMSIFSVYSSGSSSQGGEIASEIRILKMIELSLYSSIVVNDTYNIAPEFYSTATSEQTEHPASYANDRNTSTYWGCPNPVEQQFSLILSE